MIIFYVRCNQYNPSPRASYIFTKLFVKHSYILTKHFYSDFFLFVTPTALANFEMDNVNTGFTQMITSNKSTVSMQSRSMQM